MWGPSLRHWKPLGLGSALFSSFAHSRLGESFAGSRVLTSSRRRSFHRGDRRERRGMDTLRGLCVLCGAILNGAYRGPSLLLKKEAKSAKRRSQLQITTKER